MPPQSCHWSFLLGAAVGGAAAAACCCQTRSRLPWPLCPATNNAQRRRIAQVDKRMSGRSLASIKELTQDDIDAVMTIAAKCRQLVATGGVLNTLQSKVIALIFYEPSTRTRCSFEAAAKRLGCAVVQLLDPTKSSAVKGESFADTIKMMASYCDALVIRHPAEGILDVVRSAVAEPFVNAGDGSGEHPTQSLTDLYTILSFYPVDRCQQNPLRVTIVGDLLYGRTVHSLARLLTLYNVNFSYVAPDALQMPEVLEKEIAALFELQGLDSEGRQRKVTSLDEVLPSTDILYMTRIQKERIPKYHEIPDTSAYNLSKEKLQALAPPGLKILHPLPRINEIPEDIDQDPRAAYFPQAANGLYVRMALLLLLFGKAHELWDQ